MRKNDVITRNSIFIFVRADSGTAFSVDFLCNIGAGAFAAAVTASLNEKTIAADLNARAKGRAD